MITTLVINARPYQTRVALLEDGNTVELHVERGGDENLVGNIYVGRVQRVLPGMQAAFVEIGLDKAAFLHASDLPPDPEQASLRIEDRLRAGQEVMVQIAKEPLGEKGARVTGQITLPGRHLVLLPMMQHVGVSRRIDDNEERTRLRELITRELPEGMGAIARTAAQQKEDEVLCDELNRLGSRWKRVERASGGTKAPSLLDADLSVSLRAVRDLCAGALDLIVVDHPEEYARIVDYLEMVSPELAPKVELYHGDLPIFEAYGVQSSLRKAMRRKVWMKSGGHIIIEKTEALTVVDVNTGRFVGARDLEDTILKTNLEAAEEIAAQLRLRDIGGLIVIDFIDMEDIRNQELVVERLKEALSRDRAKSVVLGISALGLVEMTRKRVRTSLGESLTEPCYYCGGSGTLRELGEVCCQIFRALEDEPMGCRKLRVRAHPRVAEMLMEGENRWLNQVCHQNGLKVEVISDSALHQKKFLIEPI